MRSHGRRRPVWLLSLLTAGWIAATATAVAQTDPGAAELDAPAQTRAFLDNGDGWRNDNCFVPPCRVGVGVLLSAPEQGDGWQRVTDDRAFLRNYHWTYRMTFWDGYDRSAYAAFAPGGQLDHDGRYEVRVGIPAVSPPHLLTERANYYVHTGSAVIHVPINQMALRGSTVTFGEFDISNAGASGGPDGGGPWIELRDYTGELDGRAVIVDTAEWLEVISFVPTQVPSNTPPPSATTTRTRTPSATPTSSSTPTGTRTSSPTRTATRRPSPRPSPSMTQGAPIGLMRYLPAVRVARVPRAPTATATRRRPPATNTPRPTATGRATLRPTATSTPHGLLVISPSNVGRLEVLQEFTADMDWLETVDFSPSGETLAWGGGGSRSGVEVAEDIERAITSRVDPNVLRVPHGSAVHAVEVFDAGQLYAGTAGRTLMAWDWTTGRQLWRRDDGGTDMAVKPDGTRLVAGGSLWSVLPAGPTLERFLGVHTSFPGSYAGTGLIGLHNSGLVVYDEAGTVRMRKDLPTDVGWIPLVSLSAGGEVIATSDTQGSTYVWRIVDGAEVMHATDAGFTIGAALTPDGRVVATAFDSGKVTLRAVSDGRLLLTIEATGGGAARAVQFSPTGRLLAIGYNGSHRVVVWGVR